MKLRLSIFLLLSLSFFKLQAKEIPAYYIRNNGDSVKIFIKNPFGLLFVSTALEKFQLNVSYRDSLNGEKKILSPDSVREFGFHYKGENIRMGAFKNSMEYVHGFGNPPAYLFLDLIRDGSMKLVAYYQSASIPGGGGSIPSATYCYIPQENKPFEIRLLHFKKDMQEHFSDCPLLLTEVEKGKFGAGTDPVEIVEFYNKNCSK